MSTAFSRLQKQLDENKPEKPIGTTTSKPGQFVSMTKTVTKKVVRTTGSKQPSYMEQNLTLYHFYRGVNEFYISGLMDVPKFPDEYCKIAVLRATFPDIIEMTSDEHGNWVKKPEVLATWGWAHFKKEGASGYRGTCIGDVIVEENGDAWFSENANEFKYLGSYPDKVGEVIGKKH